AVEEFVEAGHSKGFGEEGADLVNRWRETEVAVRRDVPLDELRKFAEGNGVTVVDTGYAYHVKSPDVDKGKGLRTVAEGLGLEAESFVAVGDSENDVATFEVVGKSFAVANADDEAEEAADEVTDESYADGFLEAVSEVRS
ncbi:MAG: HAD hydrolase family protein, partial [Halobacteria archaeon]|nr:HAD hydrolase family protein [Halobacteria archaeon]